MTATYAAEPDTAADPSPPTRTTASEDAGDRWTAVANNLPPIYAVRFG